MNDYLHFWKLLAGLGLFLFGMNLLELALKKLAGKGFRKFLTHSTDKPLSSVFGGIVATTILQSSSLVGLIVLAFVGAGIIPLVNAIGVLIGSNLGTTFTGWIVTTLGFKLIFSTFIYPLIAIGGLSYGLSAGKLKSFAQLILGFSFLLMGLDFMKESVEQLTQSADVRLMSGLPLIVYLLAGTIFTAIIQSSSATMMLILSALYGDVISLPAAAALVIGADLGTTSTVFLGSLQGAISKRRLAMAHVLFNFSVDSVAFIFLYPLLTLIAWAQLTDPLYSLVAFHSLFNLLGLLLFLPFIANFARKLELWFPENEQGISRFIQNVPENVSDVALEAIYRETRYLLHLVLHLNLRFLDASPDVISKFEREFNFPKVLATASKLEEYVAIKRLEGEIINYALRVKMEDVDLSSLQSESFAHQIENFIGAARHGVYSAKAFKDIEQDLDAFHVIGSQDFSYYFQEIKKSAIETHLAMVQLNVENIKSDQLKEALDSLIIKIDKHHLDLLSNIYTQERKINLSPIDLSTLLNVNKEIQTSADALIKSFTLL